MNRINTSRQTISARQRNCNYHPSNAPAAHVSEETRFIASQAPVLHSVDGYYVRSRKFAAQSLYYRVTCENDQWATSATDPRVANMLIAQVQAYLAS